MSARQRNTGPITTATRTEVGAPGAGLVMLAATLVCLFAGTPRAAANGAFPDSQSVMLPADHPEQIVLATTFGLVSTDDGGATWTYACESALTTVLSSDGKYVMGPPPGNRIYAISDRGAVVSGDGGCTWSRGGGDLISLPAPALPAPFDVFPDPVDANRVYVLAADQDADNPVTYLFRSLDGGLTYSGPIYTSAPRTVVTGVESAASAPGTVYVTLYDLPLPPTDPAMPAMPNPPVVVHPRLLQSLDGGDTWTSKDIEPGIGNTIPMLAAVDAADARKVYLRLMTLANLPEQFQGLAITPDAGTTWTIPVKVPKGTLTGFTRLTSETILVVGASAPPGPDEAAPPVMYRSENGGQTFTMEALPFHPLGMAQRDGTVFVATKDIVDGAALTSSTDGGQVWKARLRFRDITSVKACVRSTCRQACDFLAGRQLFRESVCAGPRAEGCGCALPPTAAAASEIGWGAGGWGAAVVTAGLLVAGVFVRRRARQRKRRRAGLVSPPLASTE